MAKKGLQICLGVSLIVFITAILFTTLGLTVFKPKQPNITAQPVGLQNIQFGGVFPNVTLNITLTMLVTIDNPNNLGTFMFHDSTASVFYHEVLVGGVPIEGRSVSARSKTNSTNSVDLMADKMVADPQFFSDLTSGSFILTSMARLHGKVDVFMFLKFSARVLSTCDITVVIKPLNIVANCSSDIKKKLKEKCRTPLDCVCP